MTTLTLTPTSASRRVHRVAAGGALEPLERRIQQHNALITVIGLVGGPADSVPGGRREVSTVAPCEDGTAVTRVSPVSCANWAHSTRAHPV